MPDPSRRRAALLREHVASVFGLPPGSARHVRISGLRSCNSVQVHFTVDWQAPGAATAAPDEAEAVADEALSGAALRAHLRCRKDSLRTFVPRRYAYKFHDLAWQTLRTQVPVHKFVGAEGEQGGFVSLHARVRQLVAVTPAAELLLRRVRGAVHLVCRLGVDGTKRWHNSLEHAALNVTNHHRAAGWHSVGVVMMAETRAGLEMFFNVTGWNEELATELRVHHPELGDLPVAFCTNADHMCRVAMGDADAPSSSQHHRRPCPYCDVSPEDLKHCTFDPLAGEGTPVSQCSAEGRPRLLTAVGWHFRPLDLLHGVSAATNCVRKLTTAVLGALGTRPYLRLDPPGTTLSDNLNFVKTDGWTVMDGLVNMRLHPRTAPDDRDLADLVGEVLAGHCQLCQGLLKHPGAPTSLPDLAQLVTQCTTQLRALLSSERLQRLGLELEATPWLHMLWYHSLQFLAFWGDLAVFGLWGLEAAHKLLKLDYELCIKALERRGTGENGPMEILARVGARLELRRLKLAPRPRAQRVQRSVAVKALERIRARCQVR